MEEISHQQYEHDKCFKEIHASSKLKHHLGPTLQQIEQKASLLVSSSFSSSSQTRNDMTQLYSSTNLHVIQKVNFFESRTCKQLMAEKFNMVSWLVYDYYL